MQISSTPIEPPPYFYPLHSGLGTEKRLELKPCVDSVGSGKREDSSTDPEGTTKKEIMAHRLNTQNGKDLYKLQKETVEPVFGIIKSVTEFRQFLLRGKEKFEFEWDLITLSYNSKVMHILNNGRILSSIL